jgi:YD repeat-containing protein
MNSPLSILATRHKAVLLAFFPALAWHDAGAATQTYDGNNRLIRLAYDDGREASFTYDAMGNPTAVTTKAGAAPSVMATDPIAGTVGSPIADYQIQVNRPGEVTGFKITGLPAGLKASTGKVANADGKAPGVIYGTPTAGGVFRVQVAAMGAKTTGSQTVITANIANPFIQEMNGFALTGKFSGVLDPSDVSGGGLGGWLAMNLAKGGAFTGSLQLGKAKYSFKGMFDGASGGAATITIARKGLPPLSLDLVLTMDGEGPGEMTGNLGDGAKTLALGIEREVWGKNKQPDLYGSMPAVPYNIAIELDPANIGDADYPQGWGFVIVTIAKTGVAKFAGQLADGTKFTASSVVTPAGEVPFFASLYAGAGSLVGVAAIDPRTEFSPLDNSVDGPAQWTRPAATKATDRLYAKGFETGVGLTGSVYVPPSAGSRVLRLGSEPVHAAVNMELTDGGLPAKRVTALTINTANKMTAFTPNDSTYKLTFTPKTGLFTGSFIPGAGIKGAKFSGLLVPDAQADLESGFGCFLNMRDATADPILSGGVWIGQ